MNATAEHIILSAEEVQEITGHTYPAKQMQWLKEHGWQFEVNAKNRPVVGRDYARMRLAGKELESVQSAATLPRFELLR